MDNEPSNEPIEPWEPELQPLPKDFHSFYHDGPFTECLVCKVQLMDGHYVVQKAYNRDEVVMEFAMCVECALDLRAEISEESYQRMSQFMEENRKLSQTYEQCNFCGTPRSECQEFTIAAACLGTEMIIHEYPLMVCGQCHSKLDVLLSKQTRDTFDGFIGEHFPGPPELEQPLPRDQFFMV